MIDDLLKFCCRFGPAFGFEVSLRPNINGKWKSPAEIVGRGGAKSINRLLGSFAIKRVERRELGDHKILQQGIGGKAPGQVVNHGFRAWDITGHRESQGCVLKVSSRARQSRTGESCF